jgi:hypothetical protein
LFYVLVVIGNAVEMEFRQFLFATLPYLPRDTALHHTTSIVTGENSPFYATNRYVRACALADLRATMSGAINNQFGG